MAEGKEIQSGGENAPKELPNQIVYLRGALEPEIMTVYQSTLLGSYGRVRLGIESIMVIAHLEKDEDSENPFDKKIVWWRDAGINDNWKPAI
jgi:hypothetical protein